MKNNWQTKKTIKGMFWHCHHDILCEYVYDYQERVDYIKSEKPKNEVETRLRLFKKIKGKLPIEFVEAGKKWDEVRKKLDEARKKWDEAWEKLDEARKKLDEARKKWDEAWEKCYEAREKYKPQLEFLHKKECGCKEWNGSEIVFK
jgi:uncharacterized coiled-coil DUF342 family protein